MSSLKIIHISDIHLPYCGKIVFRDFLNKRGFGLLSWLRRRRHSHTLTMLDDLSSAIAQTCADKILVTGDLVNFALPDEFSRAKHWLESLGSADKVIFVPGNHDFYVDVPLSDGLSRLGEYFYLSDGRDDYPFRQIFDDKICLIGLNTSIPTSVPFARGKISQKQFAIASKWIDEFKHCCSGGIVIIMLHHPPLRHQNSFFRGLPWSNYRQLHSLLNKASPCIVLHGHNHVNTEHLLNCAHSKSYIFGTASASGMITASTKGIFSDHLPRRLSSFRVFDFSFNKSGAKIETSLYIHDLEGHKYTRSEQKSLPFF